MRGVTTPRGAVMAWVVWLSALAGCDCGVRFTVPQRSRADVPGFGGRVQIVVGDIKRGRSASLRIEDEGGVTLAQQADVQPLGKVPFDVDGKPYAIRVISYEDHRLRDDLAHLSVSGLSAAQKATASRAEARAPPEAPASEPGPPVDPIDAPVPLAEVPLVAPALLPERPGTCGLRQPTIEERIVDCERVLHGEPPAHVSWQRVTRTATGLEVWRHRTTGLLWSDRLGGHAESLVSWCRANGERGRSWRGDCEPSLAGDAAELSFAAPQVDPPESWCAELPGFVTPTWLDEGKGGMRRVATAHSPSVAWALPSAQEWKAARDDGADLVVPHAAELTFWTTSAAKQGLWSVVWTVAGARAGVEPGDVGPMLHVRCVGRYRDVSWTAAVDAGPELRRDASPARGW